MAVRLHHKARDKKFVRFVYQQIHIVRLFGKMQINLLGPGLFFLILAHPVYKM
jgi:hypothetical protein